MRPDTRLNMLELVNRNTFEIALLDIYLRVF